jgi:uncharacterized damage-inducible protein DinB
VTAVRDERDDDVRATEVLADGFSRVRDEVHSLLSGDASTGVGSESGVTPEQLIYRIDTGSNTIAWLLWHLTRVQDDHVAAVAGDDQVWTSAGWAQRFAMEFAATETGYGQVPEQVGQVQPPAELLRGYFDAVHERTTAFLGGLSDEDLDRVVDERWDPPVTLGVRLVSIIGDDLQHAAQAAYVLGVAQRVAA